MYVCIYICTPQIAAHVWNTDLIKGLVSKLWLVRPNSRAGKDHLDPWAGFDPSSVHICSVVKLLQANIQYI